MVLSAIFDSAVDQSWHRVTATHGLNLRVMRMLVSTALSSSGATRTRLYVVLMALLNPQSRTFFLQRIRIVAHRLGICRWHMVVGQCAVSKTIPQGGGIW